MAGIVDLTGAVIKAFDNPATDVTFHPMRDRMPPWNLVDESRNRGDRVTIASAPIAVCGAGDALWVATARTRVVEMCMELEETGDCSNAAIACHLMTAEHDGRPDADHRRLKHTVAGPLTCKDVATMAQDIRA